MSKLIHGDNCTGARAPEYTAWDHMMQRCYNPNAKEFKNYGARGIVVCDRWHKYEEFLEDVGRRPSKSLSFGRINNDGIYEPGNVEWQTPVQQSRNRRTTKLTMAMAREIRMLYERGYSHRELAKEFEVSPRTIGSVVNNSRWKDL